MSIFPIATNVNQSTSNQGSPPAVTLGNDFDPFMNALRAMPTFNLKTDSALKADNVARVATPSDQSSTPAIGLGNDFDPFMHALLAMPTLNLKADSSIQTDSAKKADNVASVATPSDQGGSPAVGMGKDFDAAMTSFLAIPHVDSQLDAASVVSSSDGAPAGAVVEHLASAAPSMVTSSLDAQAFTAAARALTTANLAGADKLDIGSALDIKT